MALQASDLFLVERGGTQFQMTADEIATFVGAVKDYSTATIATRDAGTLTPAGTLKVGDRVFVADASADPDVDAGWAIYRVDGIGPATYEKIQEQESMDVTIVTNVNLGYTAAPGQGTIANDAGDDAVIPLADGTNAGLASPAMFNNQHVAATAALTAATNPVTVSAGQEVGFNVAQLDALP